MTTNGPQNVSRDQLICLVDLDPAQLNAGRQLLQAAGYAVHRFSDELELRRALEEGHYHPDAILIAMDGRSSDAPAERLTGLGAATGSGVHIPVIWASAGFDLPDRIAAKRAGVDALVSYPLQSQEVHSLLERLFHSPESEPYRVLFVDDTWALATAYEEIAEDSGLVARSLTDPLRLLEAIEEFQPEVVVLDLYMPQANGIELAAVLREHEKYRELDLPVIFLSGETKTELQLAALRAGGDDFLVKPIDAQHLVTTIESRARRARTNNETRRLLKSVLYEHERVRQVLDLHAIVSVADVSGRIIEVNDKFCEISGFSRQELLGQNHRIVKSGAHPQSFYAELWNEISAGQIWQGEICNRRKDGSPYWVASTIVPFLDTDGLPYQYVSIRTDITATKHGEAALRATLDATSDGVIAINGNDEIVFANRRFCEMWRVPEAAVANGASALQAYGLVQNQLLRPHAYLDVVREISTSDHDSADIIEFLDGREFERQSRRLGDSGGRVWTFHDITERRKWEKSLDQHRERLRRGQIFANIGTWDWNIQTGDLYWTERIAPLFGYPEGDLATSYENFLQAVHPDDRQSVIDAVNACVESDKPYEIEHRVVWPDGTVRWLLERGAVIRSASGKALQMLGVVQDVDDRKRAEIALAQRERELVEAQSLAHIGNWTADFSTGELSWSDEIYRIFGYQPKEVRPSVELFRSSVHSEDLVRVKDHEQLSERTGYLDVVHRIVRPDGSVRHVHELAQAETGPNGKLVRLTGTVQDVTERIEAESRIRETEARFAFAVEGAGDGIWDWNVITGEMALSGKYESMLGYEPGEIEPSIDAWARMCHPEDLVRVQAQLSDYLAGKTDSYEPELRLCCKPGNYKWILCRGTIVQRDTEGSPVRMIGIHSDISERKASEDRLALFRKIFDSSEQAMGIADATGRLLYVNHAYERITGLLSSQLVDQLMDTVYTSDARECFKRDIEPSLGRGRSWAGLLVMCRSDGTTFTAATTFGALRDELGVVQNVFCIFTDFSEELIRRAELAQAKEVAERANQAKSEFLSSMSHELRTPMNAIIGFAQMLEYDSELSADQQDNVQEILQAGRHLLALINEVLDLAKIESGRLDLSMESVELRPVGEECLQLVRPLAERGRISLDFQIAPTHVVFADRTRLKQVLLNLVSNAIKYNRPDGRVDLKVTKAGDGRVRVSIADTGLGIAPERINEIFQPFNRAGAESTEIEGSGIGLTITRRLVEMMGGSIGVESTVGVGSTFWIELAIGQEGKADARELASTGGLPMNATSRSATVLVIDDNPANLKLIVQILGMRDHLHLISAHTPELGLELAIAHQPELILLDINMPGMNGYEVLECFKAEASLCSTPVIAITANAMPRDVERGRAAGFTDYLVKPLDIETFLQSVDRCLSAGQG